MPNFRTEHDSMGELKVPADALWGAQTQRAVDNFPISGLTLPRDFIRALGLIKAAAADANLKLGHLKSTQAAAIRKAAQRVAAGEFDAQFPIDIFQTGSGTSTNMNANEVIAHIASTTSRVKIHPNDHVNYGQSSNDTIPTTLRVSAAVATREQLLPALNAGFIDAATLIVSPVRGLRPSRAARLRTANVPKPTTVTVSPFFRALVIAAMTASTARPASAFVSSAPSATASINSALFMLGNSGWETADGDRGRPMRARVARAS